jgi:hypothetical protein
MKRDEKKTRGTDIVSVSGWYGPLDALLGVKCKASILGAQNQSRGRSLCDNKKNSCLLAKEPVKKAEFYCNASKGDLRIS